MQPILRWPLPAARLVPGCQPPFAHLAVAARGGSCRGGCVGGDGVGAPGSDARVCCLARGLGSVAGVLNLPIDEREIVRPRSPQPA